MSSKSRIATFCLLILPALATLSMTVAAYASPAPAGIALMTVGAVLSWLVVGRLVSGFAAQKATIERENAVIHAALPSLALLPLLFFVAQWLLSNRFVNDSAVRFAFLIAHAVAMASFFILARAGCPSRA